MPKPWVVPSNGFFDTTEAQAATHGFSPLNLFDPHFHDPFPVEDVETRNPFKGNIDLDRLKETLDRKDCTVPFILITITNNTGAGQPVSLANLRGVAELAHAKDIPVIFDQRQRNW